MPGNKFTLPQPVFMEGQEDLHTVIQLITPDDYLFTFDLKSGYHHVNTSLQHWQCLLGFA